MGKSNPTISVADAMFIAAESVVAAAKKSGTDINVFDVYQKDSAQLALIAGFIAEYAGAVAGAKIEITKE